MSWCSLDATVINSKIGYIIVVPVMSHIINYLLNLADERPEGIELLREILDSD